MGIRHSRRPAAGALGAAALAWAWSAAALAAGGTAVPESALAAPIVNGLPVAGHPSVGLLAYPHVECTVTLVGCQTVVTAAHCLCYDFGVDPPRALRGEECLERSDLLDPEGKQVFLQHAGVFGLSSVSLHPGWTSNGARNDLAVLRLDRPVAGVRPSAINRAGPLPAGSEGVVVGFGRTHRDVEDQAIKRAGSVTTSTSSCSSGMICWWLEEPLGPPGEGSGACYNDSGGPLFADLGAGPVLAGVTHSTSSSTCRSPSANRSVEIFREHAWIAAVAGPDLGAGVCGDLPQAQGPGTRVAGSTGHLSAAQPRAELDLEVSPGTRLLRVALNASGVVEPATNDFDLFVRRRRSAGPEAPACSGTSPQGLEVCEIDAPKPGTWTVGVQRVRGAGEFQLTATQFDGQPAELPAPPPPPPGPWLASAALAGFDVQVRLGNGGGTAGSLVEDCIAETLCTSGAVPGRPEVFVKVIGPRPNGFLWVQVSRFTPSRVELWVRRESTGEIRHYVLPAVGPSGDEVPGLQDRRAFSE